MEEGNQNAILTPPAEHFRSRKFGLFLVWLLIISAGVGTFILSRNLNLESQNEASVIRGTNFTYEVSLVKGKAIPNTVVMRPGDEVRFVVKDGSWHNMAEERSKKSDARLESGELEKDDSYSLVFTEKGEFSFYDRQNQDIRVTITVR